jgi:pSer/pThr/pTyr-binding forkhead associated (FHA) protein
MLWADGEMTLRVEGTDQVVRIDRPFALVGQGSHCDIRLAGAAVNRRHVYLHLDPRGVFAVDLATRSGMRIHGADEVAGWLGPGDWLEVGGQRIELLRIQVDGVVVDPPPCDDDPLAETGADAGLVALGLEPRHGPDGPWTASSELMFLGWSSACAIQVKDPSVAKVHCVLVRTAEGAYLVDLQGEQTRVDDRPVRGASRLEDGAALGIGATRFTVRLGPATRHASVSAPLVARVIDPEIVHEEDDSARDLVPAASQQALWAWMVETLQQTQGAVLRQQGEMQANLAGMLQQIQQDNSALLNAHLERIGRIDHELASLRAELAERGEAAAAPPAPPPVPPLRIERTTPEPSRSRSSTTWLLQRVNQLENENRSAWKDLLGRVTAPPRRGSGS